MYEPIPWVVEMTVCKCGQTRCLECTVIGECSQCGDKLENYQKNLKPIESRTNALKQMLGGS